MNNYKIFGLAKLEVSSAAVGSEQWTAVRLAVVSSEQWAVKIYKNNNKNK